MDAFDYVMLMLLLVMALYGFVSILWYLCLALAGWLIEHKKRPSKPKPKIRWLKLLINPPCPVCGHGIRQHKEEKHELYFSVYGGCYKTPPKEVVKSYDGALLTERSVEICDCRVRPHEIRTHYRLAHRQRKGAV